MADKTVGSLDIASGINDVSNFVCEDGGVAKRVTGKQIKDFAKKNVEEYVESAVESAKSAESNAGLAVKAASNAEHAKTSADESKTSAELNARNARVMAEGGKYETKSGGISIYRAVPGAKNYADQAYCYVEGGAFDDNPFDDITNTIRTDGAKNLSDKAKAFAEGGSYKEWEKNGIEYDWKTKTVEKGAKQYAEAAEFAKMAAETAASSAESFKETAETAASSADTAKKAAAQSALDAKNDADRAEAATVNTPKVQNGTWWVYDKAAGSYVDSGVSAYYKPVRGTDYWTAEDQAAIVSDVLAALPDGTEVRY